MFKSSEKLRHEAAQRQLDRVASSWRNARTTWFDGTPEAIEARLAETNRILAVARSGYSPAHLGLTVEAENARRELLAAQHRLMTDFLDDGARAFQGSRRVAGDGICDYCGQDYRREGHAENCGEYLNDADSPLLDDGSLDRSGYPDHFSDHDLIQEYIRRKSHRTAAWPNNGDEDRYDENGDYTGTPWPEDLAHHLTSGSPHAGYDAGHDASWHPAFRDSGDRWGDAGEAWYNAGGHGKGLGEGFDDGWIDSASDIPHRYNDPEGYAAYHADSM